MSEKDCKRVCIWQRPELKRRKRRVRKGGCHHEKQESLEKCNKKAGRKRGTKEKVKAIKQMSLVKQGSKDKGREGGTGRGGRGHLGRGRAG